MNSQAINIYNTLIANGFNETLAKFATAQSAHETAGWTSNVYKKNNNAFGMTFAGQDASLGDTDKDGYANYVSVNYSCLDLIRWYIRHRNKIFSLPLTIKTLTDYVKFLKNYDYFEAPESEYLAGCEYFFTKFKNDV